MSSSTQNLVDQASSHECNKMHIHPAALDALTEIVERLRFGKVPGCVGAQDDWFEELDSPAPVLLVHDPSQTVDDKKSAARLSVALDSLQLAITALSTIQEHVLLQKETCERRLISLRARGGLSSLPDDVLSLVMEHASEEGNSAAKVALRLSHICHRFRQIALRIPTLWSNIWGSMDINLVSLFWDRITIPVATIIFDNGVYGVSSAVEVAPFIRCVTARSELWSKVYHAFAPNVALNRDILDVMAHETHQLHAPFLSFLYIEGSRSRSILQDPPLENSLHYYSSWIMPRLTKFAVENFIPIPLMNATSLTVFRFVHRLNNKQTEELNEIRAGERLSSLILFLGSCPTLQTVAMVIEFFPEFIDFAPNEFADLPNVEMLELSLINCQGTVLRSFLEHIHFPNVSTMELRFFASSASISIQDDLDAVFWDLHKFDSLANLTFTTLSHDQIPPLRFPFSSLSRLRHLTFIGNMADYEKILHEGPCLPALRSLTFENCDIQDRNWTESLLARLKSQGNIPEVREIRTARR
ncbi:hypothetical protein SCHPADRAFT_944895 [Schizopora paradoxa]|uniref:F-box domain-containing protein n=1 Tax=Schizopora paradoxa TaxID=27342 RepID=A0A0H2R7N8_9AGAM|nr:hypothetical protein SCHPADRAFT_944895 [Schizopora paradoxa]